jgi:hypothetical protein
MFTVLLAASAVGFATPALAQDDTVKIAPAGFISVTGVYRSTNVVNLNGNASLPTNFGGIPYPNTVQGNIGETKITGADTRLGLTADVNFGQARVHGLFLGDFLGFDPANVAVSANGHTFRLYLGYAEIHVGQVDVLGGQAWSWMTPNRRGLSSDPADVFDTMNIDPNLQVGLAWTRAGEVHFVHHLTKQLAWGVGIENQDQFVGVGEVILPFAFNAVLGQQFDAGNNPGAPARFPDLVAKVAVDPDFGTSHAHVEAAGILRQFAVTTADIITPAPPTTEFTDKSATG